MRKFLLLLLLSLTAISLHARDIEIYNRMIEPTFPLYVNKFDLLPRREQHLIRVALYEFYTEMEIFAEKFIPATEDILTQKLFLEMELKKLYTLYPNENELIRERALKTVLAEQDIMLENMEITRFKQEKRLHDELQLKIYKILNDWNRANPRQADLLLRW